MNVDISFPGLGIDTFTVNKVAFTVFGLDIRWYGILITLGMIFAFSYAIYRSRQEGFIPDDVLDMGLYMVIFGVIGARLYYVLMKLDTYILPGRSFLGNLKAMVNIREGGLAIYGGIIAGGLTLYLFCRIKKRSWKRALDMVSPGVMMAQAMGRWGNFFNGEAYGGLVSEGSPLYFLRMGLYPNELSNTTAYVHPTFLYESMWNILGFILINAFIYRRKKFDGQIVLTYLAWYGFGRMFIEGLRTDSLYIGSLRVSQVVGLLCFLVCSTLIVWILLKIKKEQTARAAAEGYQPVYAKASAQQNAETEEDQPESSKTSEQAEKDAETDDKKEGEGGRMATIIDGKATAGEIYEELKEKTRLLKEKTGVVPQLAVVLVGDDPASQVYVRNKGRACAEVGFLSKQINLPASTTQEKLNGVIDELNADASVHGILVQLPLPKGLDEKEILLRIDPKKDVDAFHPLNVGRLVAGDPTFLPCTPAGVMELLSRYGISVAGKRCVIVGRSNIVGKPLFHLLLAANGTVTVCHSKTEDLASVTRQADIFIAAIGKAKFFTGDMIKPGAVVIDVGMNRDENGKLCGDVDAASVEPIASYMTKVPGGVGPMTIAMLMKNTLRAALMATGAEGVDTL